MIDSKQKLATLKRKKRPKLKYPEKFQAFLLLIVFVLLILFFNISGIITQDVEFSKEENRSLAQKPSLSVSDLLDGSYSKNLDSYFSDQFYLRNSWIRLKVNLDLLLGKQESNGVYIGKDNYLMEIPVTPDSEWLNKNLKAIDAQLRNVETERHIKFDKAKQAENQLKDDDLKGWDDMAVRLKQHLNPESVLFRHAVRVSIVLFIGYVFVQLTDIEYGYWILLTALFVSQPNFNATKRRLYLRIVGTLIGIILVLLYWITTCLYNQQVHLVSFLPK